MDKFTHLFEEFIQKAMAMTEALLVSDFGETTDFESFTGNRERLFGILDQISGQIDWNQVTEERRAELSRQIEYLKKLDDDLLVKLHAYQAEVKREIEQTVRSKDNIKGYNLSDVK